jgi:hypothetical protein
MDLLLHYDVLSLLRLVKCVAKLLHWLEKSVINMIWLLNPVFWFVQGPGGLLLVLPTYLQSYFQFYGWGCQKSHHIIRCGLTWGLVFIHNIVATWDMLYMKDLITCNTKHTHVPKELLRAKMWYMNHLLCGTWNIHYVKGRHQHLP